MKPLIVLASAGCLALLGPVQGQPPPKSAAATQQPLSSAAPASLKPAKPLRVVNLKHGSFVIDKSGDWVLNRNWRFDDPADIGPILIDVVADNVVLDFRGFEIAVGLFDAPPVITVIRVQGDNFTLMNAEASICCEGGSLLHSTGHATRIFRLNGSSHDPITLEGDDAVISDSSIGTHFGVSVAASSSRIQNNFIGCIAFCLVFSGDENVALNNRIQPDQEVALRVTGNGNVLAGNFIDVQPTGPDVEIGLRVDGNSNVVRDNTFAVNGFLDVAIDVSGTGNVLDANIADRIVESAQSRISVGIRFQSDGNFYGDNRMQATVPFDLGGTTQTDWDGNVGY